MLTLKFYRLVEWLKSYSVCLASTRPWVQIPVPPKKKKKPYKTKTNLNRYNLTEGFGAGGVSQWQYSLHAGGPGLHPDTVKEKGEDDPEKKPNF
jgi:hypothetical protein